MEDEEEKRRRRKEQKKAKKERRAKEEKEGKKEKEEAAGGNIGYFVMRTPSVLDNSKQDDEDYRKPIKSDLGSRTISNNTQNRNPDQPLPWEKDSEGRSEEVKKLRERSEVTMKTGDSSEEEDAQFFDSVSTPSQQQRNKSMGVLYFCPLSYL